MMGFDFALSIGVDLLEFDVLLTRDDIPVITHNHEFHGSAVRGPDGAFLNGEHPRVASLTMAEIERFDIGRLNADTEYGRRFPDQAQLDGVRVPRLRELLHLVSQPGYETACLMLNWKSDPDLARDVKARENIVSTVCEEVRSAELTERTLLHSFDWALLAECRRQAPDMPLSFLTQLQDKGHDIGEESSILSRRTSTIPTYRCGRGQQGGRVALVPSFQRTASRCSRARGTRSDCRCLDGERAA